MHDGSWNKNRMTEAGKKTEDSSVWRAAFRQDSAAGRNATGGVLGRLRMRQSTRKKNCTFVNSLGRWNTDPARGICVLGL